MGARLATQVKICGLTSPEDAVAAVDLGAGFVGLNFHRPSPRYVEPARAAEIAAAVRGRATVVGVFVGASAAELEAISTRVGLDLLQFHGDEAPEVVRPFAARAIKVLRVAERFDSRLADGFEDVWGFLVDARRPGIWGGTGSSWRFETLSLPGSLPARRVFVAGGIGPGNVGAAIAAARPWGIDVASGVESAPGKKDPRLLAALFQEIRDVEASNAA